MFAENRVMNDYSLVDWFISICGTGLAWVPELRSRLMQGF